MSIRSSRRCRGKLPLAEMNVVPLVDVMLVLLVIFIVTAPLLTHAVKIDLPKATSSINQTKPDHIEFGIRESGALFWNGEEIRLDELSAKFSLEAAKQVAQVMSIAAKSGIVRIGFVSDPSP
jgi:biopolymer transport protein ExbD